MNSSPETEVLTQLVRQRGKPFRVLIVDDEKWVQDVFKDFCELTQAFDIDLAGDGQDAIAKVRGSQYDLITLDLIMPEMSGLDVLSAIKDISPEVPVMIITGNATEKLVTEAGIMGACRVMYKPVMMETFISEVTSALQR
ncbi:MAG TPA: response regulator [candidate division Zixibacteria bacterium]|nr:response regulator [candidate division Zixibacteria bacterium]